MAKETGLGAGLMLNQYDLSGDVGSVQSIASERGLLDVTSIDKSAMERLLGLKTGVIEFAAYHNPSTGQSHAVLSTNPTTDVLVTYLHGSTVGNPAASVSGKQIGYPGNVGQDGSYVHNIVVQDNGSYGVEWGVMLTAGKESYATGTVNGTGVDQGAATTAGAAAYLHCITMPSGTATFKVQDSADNVTFADVTGLTFTNATGPTSQRLETAAGATIRRYVRFQGSGTHGTSAVVCNFVRF